MIDEMRIDGMINEQLIHNFYNAFGQKDYVTMQQAYADMAVFNDAVFKNLNANEVRAMWQMLILRSTDMQLEFTHVKADEKTGSAQWTATYTFTTTGRKVINRIQANFVFENGKIIRHTDDFNFYTWARQAFGFKGWLLGKTAFFRNKVQQTARGNLKTFMQKQHHH